jgi:hypothetical protein
MKEVERGRDRDYERGRERDRDRDYERDDRDRDRDYERGDRRDYERGDIVNRAAYNEYARILSRLQSSIDILDSIREAVFTGRINKNTQFFSNFYLYNQRTMTDIFTKIMTLLENVRFIDLYRLYKTPIFRENKLFRCVKLSNIPAENSNMLSILPTSWTYNYIFAKRTWCSAYDPGEHPCILQIDLNHHAHLNIIINIQNEEQKEVILMPCIIEVIEIINERELTIIKCTIKKSMRSEEIFGIETIINKYRRDIPEAASTDRFIIDNLTNPILIGILNNRIYEENGGDE